MKLLVKHGADVNIPDAAGFTPLSHAKKLGIWELEIVLFASGAVEGAHDPEMYDRRAKEMIAEKMIKLKGEDHFDAKDEVQMAILKEELRKGFQPQYKERYGEGNMNDVD